MKIINIIILVLIFGGFIFIYIVSKAKPMKEINDEILEDKLNELNHD